MRPLVDVMSGRTARHKPQRCQKDCWIQAARPERAETGSVVWPDWLPLSASVIRMLMKSTRCMIESSSFFEPARHHVALVSLVAPFAIAGAKLGVIENYAPEASNEQEQNSVAVLVPTIGS